MCGKNPLHSSWIPKVAGKLASGNGRKHRESLKVSLSDLSDFSVMMVTVVKEKHAVVALEVVEDDDDVPIVAVLVHGYFL